MRLDPVTGRTLATGALLCVGFACLASGSGAQESFVTWQHPSGLITAEVPAGWQIDGQLGNAMDQGQFRINAFSPDGLSFVSIGHNWLSFMEYQYGPYQPGHATVENIVLPQFLASWPGYVDARITYRSGNSRLAFTNPATGIPIPFDSGTLGFLLQRQDGGFSAGTAFGETMYIASPGTPGLWRLRLFAAAVAPAEANAQERVRTTLDRVFSTLELSPQFFTLWSQSFQHTREQMRSYGEAMDRVFSDYLRSAARSSSGDGGDPLEGWASMMRGGEYAEDETTGEQYWVSDDRDHWYVNDSGTVVGNDTGDPPTRSGNWRRLDRIGQ